MAGDTMRFRNPAGHAGLLNNFVSLANSLAGFFEARVTLFARESKGALLHLLLLAGALMMALVLIGSGYVFLVVGLIFAIAHALGVGWVSVALCIAALHFLLAIICVIFARAQFTKPMFRDSLQELKKDREWLKDLDRKNR